ncbi:hypothetical protein OAT13_01080 [Gammaproteobacteria bacterium]|nr:hypothetical protein [Gammaproteobacteria bacterium]
MPSNDKLLSQPSVIVFGASGAIGSTLVASFDRNRYTVLAGTRNLVQGDQSNLDVVMEKFNHDKKYQTNNYRMVVPTGDGVLTLVAVSKQKDERNRIESAYIKGLHEIGYPGF